MRRDLPKMQETTYDVLIIGGGITGATILREAALKGLKAALLEKKDFSHATSSGTSKLVHGGLRYLRTFEFGLIRESLAERRIWERIAPHQVYPLPFLVPTTAGAVAGRLIMSAGLTAYDWLAYDSGWLEDLDQRIPGHTRLSRAETLAAEPVLARDGLTGSHKYFDCQMYAPERLGFECIKDAVALGADAANYAEVTGFLRDGTAIAGVQVRDAETGKTYTIRSRTTVNASGPWADRLIGIAEGGEPSHRLIRSKGIHLIVRPLTNTHAVTMISSSGHFFVLPWRGHTILGTTDTVYHGDPDKVGITEREIEDFLAVVNAGLPAAKVTRADVVHWYVGLRPLVDDGSKESKGGESYGTSRRAEICDHAEEGAPGLFSAIGGKWTTSRHIAEKTIAAVAEKLGHRLPDVSSAATPLGAGRIGNFARYRDAAINEAPSLAPETVTALVRQYGAGWRDVRALAEIEPDRFGRPLSNERPDIGAQIALAARVEMARTLEDALFRRSGIGTLGHPGEAALARAGEIMGKELGWDDARTADEIASAARRYAVQPNEAESARP